MPPTIHSVFISRHISAINSRPVHGTRPHRLTVIFSFLASPVFTRTLRLFTNAQCTTARVTKIHILTTSFSCYFYILFRPFELTTASITSAHNLLKTRKQTEILADHLSSISFIRSPRSSIITASHHPALMLSIGFTLSMIFAVGPIAASITSAGLYAPGASSIGSTEV